MLLFVVINIITLNLIARADSKTKCDFPIKLAFYPMGKGVYSMSTEPKALSGLFYRYKGLDSSRFS